jgi:calcineurin-like phosphoesterase family protein
MNVNNPYYNEVFDASKVFFTADLHFGHKNIIKYCNRPYPSIESMNESIVEIWNKYVPNDADVFILGDVAFSMTKNKIRELLNSMNGRKHLVIGNHDKLDELPLDCFVHISMQDQIVIKTEGEDSTSSYTTVILSHYPLMRWAGCSRGVFSLHGHEHGAIKNKDYMLNQMDVGWDTTYKANDYGYVSALSPKPYSWQDICDAFTKRMMTNDGKPIEGF